MKIFHFMGRNAKNRSGVSWKVWKIARHGRSITKYWGPARLHLRKVVPTYTRSATKRFKTIGEAIKYERRVIRSKLMKGYEKRTRWR